MKIDAFDPLDLYTVAKGDIPNVNEITLNFSRDIHFRNSIFIMFGTMMI